MNQQWTLKKSPGTRVPELEKMRNGVLPHHYVIGSWLKNLKSM
jgi:hypothetical protein